MIKINEKTYTTRTITIHRIYFDIIIRKQVENKNSISYSFVKFIKKIKLCEC